MSPQEAYQKYRALIRPIAVGQARFAGPFERAIFAMPRPALEPVTVVNEDVGNFIFYDDSIIDVQRDLDDTRALIGEVVFATTDNARMTTIYEASPVFASAQALIAARREMIETISEHYQVPHGVIAAPDKTRGGRVIMLAEMGSAQLLDFLQSISTSLVLPN